MGGNAIKTVTLRRLTKDEFEPYTKEVVDKLLTKFSYVSPLKYYRNKQSFGDLDLILKMSEDVSHEKTKSIINELFNSKEIYENDNTYSFEYKEFQVDLIFKKDEDVQSTEFFFSYNDLNNLVGRIAHKFDLKFGFDGLNYVIRDHHGSLYKRILISKDERKIYEFLDLSYDRFLQGFDEVQEIFDFVISSKYFDSSIFSYENLNHQNRTRNRKRANYAGFLEYMNSNAIERVYNFEKDKTVYLPMINNFFPESNLIQKLEDIRIQFQKQNELNEKFRGDMIMELTGLRGAQLGKFILTYKSQFTNFNAYLQSKSKEEIQNEVKKYHDTYLMFIDETNLI